MKKVIAVVMVTVVLLICITSYIKYSEFNRFENVDEFWNYLETLDIEKLTPEEFFDKYYQSLLYKPLNGSWRQNDIIYLLTRCITEDIDRNGVESPFCFLLGKETLFFYTINTSMGETSVSFLVEKSSLDLEYEFVSFIMFITDYGEQYDDLDSYKLEVCNVKNISFKDSDDFLNYIRKESNGSIFFERGWVKINDPYDSSLS